MARIFLRVLISTLAKHLRPSIAWHKYTEKKFRNYASMKTSGTRLLVANNTNRVLRPILTSNLYILIIFQRFVFKLFLTNNHGIEATHQHQCQ